MREIIFYTTKNGSSPIEEFLDALSGKQAKKVVWVLQLIETLDSIPAQYFKKLDGTQDIWEIRVDFGSDAFRLLGFLDDGKLVVLTNGFAKKTQKTPVSEISLAERRKKDYQSRKRKK